MSKALSFLPVIVLWAHWVFGALSVAWASQARKLTLPELIQEATARHARIQEVKNLAEAASHRSAQAFSPFLPELGVEGGWERWQTNASGNFGYVYGRYNLFRGWQDRIQLDLRESEESLARLEFERTRNWVEREVSAHYYQLLHIDESIRLKEEALSLNLEQIERVNKRVRTGLTSNVDQLEFSLRETLLESDLLLLRQKRVEAQANLALAVGHDRGDAAIEITGSLAEPALDRRSGMNASDRLKIALKQRQDIKAAEQSELAARLAHRSTLGEWLPQINVEALFGKSPLQEREVSGTPASALIFKVTLPLFSGLSSHHERQARAFEVARAEASLELKKIEIQNGVEIASARLDALEKRLPLEEKNAARAREYYALTLSEYNRGVKNSPDLAGATERMFETRQRLLDFRKDYQLARIALAAELEERP